METFISNSQTGRSPEEREQLVDTARSEAVRVLRHCSHRLGFKASAQRGGYPQVWARDSMITLLGALFSDDEKVLEAARASHDTLRRRQTARGLIPNYVDTRNRSASFHIYADGGALYVIATAALYRHRPNKKWLRQVWPSVAAALEWYAYQDTDQSGLVSYQEAADWKDLLAVRGKGLFVNALLYLALRRAAYLGRQLGKTKEPREYSRRAAALKRAANRRLWYDGSEATPERLFQMYHGKFRSALEAKHVRETIDRRVIPENRRLPKERYYLPYVTHYGFGDWFDSLGNLMAALGGLADADQTDDILDLIDSRGLAAQGPLAAIHPPIREGEPDWRDYYANFGLNLPDQYHNGGLWPMVGGFYVAALVKAGRLDDARAQLAALAELNRRGIDGEWEFNEWLHGRDGRPLGKREQAWSAGMFLFAHECVRRRRVSFM
ncbi:amylo-alpha-1,6-glucosidase [Patescibacteria group bacterium]